MSPSINLTIVLHADNELDEVEVFGNRFKHPDKIETLTRLPLAPYEQIQSISIISDKLIEQQGNLTLADATRNVLAYTLSQLMVTAVKVCHQEGLGAYQFLKTV